MSGKLLGLIRGVLLWHMYILRCKGPSFSVEEIMKLMFCVLNLSMLQIKKYMHAISLMQLVPAITEFWY